MVRGDPDVAIGHERSELDFATLVGCSGVHGGSMGRTRRRPQCGPLTAQLPLAVVGLQLWWDDFY